MKKLFYRVASMFMVLVFLVYAAVPIFANYNIPTKELKKGDSSVDVVVLKNMLYEGGFYAGVTKHEVNNDLNSEHFGPFTENFVKRFQRFNSITETGKADVNTLNILAKRLLEKGILHNQESTTLFLKRVESRASTETKGFIRTIINELNRINWIDVLVTYGIAAAAAAISAICLPLIGVVGVIAVSAGIGAVVNGASEYLQQKAVSDEIDWTRVGIKALGGAAKGAICAIPGVGAVTAGLGVAAAGTAENLGCSVATTGEFSQEAAGNALLNGAAQGLAAGAAVYTVGAVKTQVDKLFDKVKADYINSKQILTQTNSSGNPLLDGIRNNLMPNPADQFANTIGTEVIQPAINLAVNAVTISKGINAINELDSPSPPSGEETHTQLSNLDSTPQKKFPNGTKADKVFNKAKQDYIDNKQAQQQTDLPNINKNIQGGAAEEEITPPSGKGAQPTTKAKTSTNFEKSMEKYNSERLRVENGVKNIHESGRSKIQKNEESGKIYSNAEKYFQSEFKREHNRITELAKNEKREIMPDEQKLLDDLHTHSIQMTQQKRLCAGALHGNDKAQGKVLENSLTTIEQIRRYQQMLNQLFCNGLANMYR